MNASMRRRRGVLLLLLAALAGSMAASRVRGEEHAVRSQVGPLMPVVVARTPIAAHTRLGPDQVAERFAVARIPRRFVPAGVVRNPLKVIGTTTAVRIGRGSYLPTDALA